MAERYLNYQIYFANENTLLLEWPEQICPKLHQYIIECQQSLSKALGNKLNDSIASYASLMLSFSIMPSNYQAQIAEVQKIIKHCNSQASSEISTKVVNIPVLYNESAGWDLDFVANQSKLSIQDVINKHSTTAYHAYATGFTPGFCYLGELVSCLQLPRKASPRTRIPKGAVAIAQSQTAVYPNTSPGGWHIIGQTPLTMYQNDKDHFIPVINVGDEVKFYAISEKEFIALGGKIDLE